MPFPDGLGMSGDPFAGAYTATQTGGPSAPVLQDAPPEAAPVGLTGDPLGPPSGLWAQDWRAAPAVAPIEHDQTSGGFSLGTPGRFDVDAALAQSGAQSDAANLSAFLETVPAEPVIDQQALLLSALAEMGVAPPAADADEDHTHLAILYGVGVPLNLSAEANDLIWKVACKTGILALSPGPGQTDLEKPLELTPDLFDNLLVGFNEKAFPYVTIPETHANGALENTGYVKALEKLTKAQLMADPRITPEGKAHVAGDADDIEYLLAGMGFTDPVAKEKALNGSIPDTSIGVKFGYRNKRTGNTYDALEHIALTPIPWVDGNIPFNPAMVLGVTPFDQEYEESQEQVPFDGVYTERPALELATEIRTTGDAFNPAATRAALMALTPGDSLSWNWDVNVERLQAPGDDGDGSYYLVRAPESADPMDYDWERKPALYTDLESAMGAVSRGVATCLQRRANEKARHDAIGARGDQPAMAKYGAEPGTDLNLAIEFDPQKHPKDYKGRFKKTLGSLKPGETAKLPDGITVRRKTQGLEGFHIGTSGPGAGGGNLASADNADEAAKEALTRSTSAGKKGELPDSLGHEPGGPGHKPGDMLSDKRGFKYKVEKVDDAWVHLRTGSAPGDEPHDVGQSFRVPHHKMDALGLKKDGDGPDSEGAGDADAWDGTGSPGKGQTVTFNKKGGGEATGQVLEVEKAEQPDRPYYVRTPDGKERWVSEEELKLPGAKLSATGAEDEDTLSLSTQLDSLGNANPTEETGMTPTTLPGSVEELLAQQQAEIERLNGLVDTQGVQLSAATQTVTALSTVTHRDQVLKQIAGLSKHYPPSVLLAAQQVMVKDVPGADYSDGFNLSVQAPKADGTGLEAKELKSPSEIVAFMLSAIPTKDGQAAHDLARLHDGLLDGLDAFNLSAHDAANGSLESREATAVAAVDEWEKKNYPERFGADGKRITG